MALADSLRDTDIPKRSTEPLWKGPEVDGITSSLLQRFLCCPERFHLLTIEGLKAAERFNKYLEYGNMWHICEEYLAQGQDYTEPLKQYALKLLQVYPFDREEVEKWWNVCRVQFPVYVQFWRDHPDVTARTPILSETCFIVPYPLPDGRTVRLRGKWDSVDLIGQGKTARVWLQENKTKSEVDEAALRRQLKFDVQTMLYLTALDAEQDNSFWRRANKAWRNIPIAGVRYNVIRRPLSGGKGTIRPHQAKTNKKTGVTTEPAETMDHFYDRLKTEYLEAEPETYFFRWNAEVSKSDIKRFRKRFLDPVLTRLCLWYDWMVKCKKTGDDPFRNGHLHWQHPYGVRNLIDEGGQGDTDAYLETGSEAGLVRTKNLFPELTEVV